MPVSISSYAKRCPQDTPPDPHAKCDVKPLSPDAYRFSGTVPVRDYDDNIISTVFTNSRTDKFYERPLRTRNLSFGRN